MGSGQSGVPRLLVVHHTPSPAMETMLQAVLAGARDPEITGVEVVVKPALAATAADVVAADGFLLGSPVNIGYISGALKHFFDTVYYPCLHAKSGAPYGYWLHADNDATGAVRALESITQGLSWAKSQDPVIAFGPVDRGIEQSCYDLGGTVAALLMDAAN